MNPQNQQPGTPYSDQPQPDQSISQQPQQAVSPFAQSQPAQQHQDAAANVIRSQIDTLYGANPQPAPQQQVAPQQHAQQQQQLSQTSLQESLDTQNPYHRTHQPHPQPQAEQWKAYHSAWQQYYQKYYEQYYTKETNAHKEHLTAQQQAAQLQSSPQEETISQDEALVELRQKLLGKVQASAKKVRKSRHFIPIMAACAVVLIFVFIQYNRVFIANVQAYVAPGSVDPQNIVIDPAAEVVVGEESRLIIPKINVDVPVLYDVATDHASQMAAMEQGVAHFPIPGANSHPGEVGNTVLSGHSSNDLFDPGAYKFIFAQLEKLQVGDTIYANYGGKRYTYVIKNTEVVKPSEVNKLIYPTDKPIMTLITCTPLGTALNRLLVTAEQVSPDPTAAAAAPEGSGDSGNASPMPGNSATMFERLFGGGN